MSQRTRSAQRKSNGVEAKNGKSPLYFTFGNHMHWVDMEWLWGYHVLPGSVRDMLDLIKETGAKGNVNFEGIGYEKMAAECPEALAELRAAVQRGDVEPVGCSYGQPYGLFQGGESNIRQFTYGVRSVMRLLGVRPRSFWEEEFYFFPQLPQVLKGCGYTGACLFFQWTWHTPEIPKEPCSLILWEGIDGTRIPTLPRNELNLHQWPEDFEGVLDRVAEKKWQSGKVAEWQSEGNGKELTPAIVQWLELMPSKDWMCRSEVLLPRLKELMGDRRFDVRARTVGGLIKELSDEATERRSDERGGAVVPVRRYSMDDVWHGMTLGKNGDEHPRASSRVEQGIVLAEAMSATASLFGRPYASWDVYPTWELDEAWRESLAAQHHDNHECEGLCGFVGHRQFASAERSAGEVLGRAAWLLTRRAGRHSDDGIALNPHGWTEHIQTVGAYQGGVYKPSAGLEVPPFGYRVRNSGKRRGTRVKVARKGRAWVISRGDVSCRVDAASGCITYVQNADAAFGDVETALFGFQITKAGRAWNHKRARVSVAPNMDGQELLIVRKLPGGIEVRTYVAIEEAADGINVVMDYRGRDEPGETLRPDPGMNAALQASLRFGREGFTCRADSPLSVEEVRGSGEVKRKYPHGDWMTSPQWFETLRDPFTSYSFVDITGENGDGLLVCHDGSQQWFRDADGVRVILTAYDPWDEGRYSAWGGAACRFRLVPHARLTEAECRRSAADARFMGGYLDFDSQPVGGGSAEGVESDIPPTFGPLEVCDAPNVLAHAFFRESMKSGEHLPDWAGHRMFQESDGACDHPFVIRLVEWNGEPARVRLKLAGKVAFAAKTNLMGEAVTERRPPSDGATKGETGRLSVRHPAVPPWWGKANGQVVKFRGKPITWSEVEFEMRPREIATIYADMVMGRKEFRDLDAKRKVWATVHKTGSGGVAKGRSGKARKRAR